MQTALLANADGVYGKAGTVRAEKSELVQPSARHWNGLRQGPDATLEPTCGGTEMRERLY